jgi:hypothetical protein
VAIAAHRARHTQHPRELLPPPSSTTGVGMNSTTRSGDGGQLEIAHQEALAQGTPPIATPQQHRQIAAIMATAVSMDSGGPDEQR